MKERQEILELIITLKIKMGNELLFNLPIDKREYPDLLSGLNALRDFIKDLPIENFGKKQIINEKIEAMKKQNEPDNKFIKKQRVKVARGGMTSLEATLKDHGLTYADIDENFNVTE